MCSEVFHELHFVQALDPQGVSIDEFESMIGEMHEGMVELVFAVHHLQCTRSLHR